MLHSKLILLDTIDGTTSQHLWDERGRKTSNTDVPPALIQHPPLARGVSVSNVPHPKWRIENPVRAANWLHPYATILVNQKGAVNRLASGNGAALYSRFQNPSFHASGTVIRERFEKFCDVVWVDLGSG
jgi:hypothetical protein